MVHGIAVKPGKPTIIGRINNKPVVGLPGHPASAFMIYSVFVRNILDIMSGVLHESKKTAGAVLSQNYPSDTGREEFLPVRLDIQSDICFAHPVSEILGRSKCYLMRTVMFILNAELKGLWPAVRLK